MKKKLSAGQLALILIACTLAIPVVLLGFAWLWPSGAIRISKETTYLTEPLTADGKIDYLAAIEEQYAKGITAENNFAAVLVALIPSGDGVWENLDRRDVLRRLGLERGDGNGPPMTSLRTFSWDNGDLRSETMRLQDDDSEEPIYIELQFDDDVFIPDRWISRAMQQPWTAEDYPLLAEWLRVNEASLLSMSEGVQRSRCYFPIAIPSDAAVSSIWYQRRYWHAPAIDFTVMFSIRVMQSLEQGQITDAWADVQTIYQLAAHLQSQPTTDSKRIGYLVDRIASRMVGRLLHYGQPDELMLLRIEEFLESLPTVAALQAEIVGAQRWEALDFLQHEPEVDLRDYTSLPDIYCKNADWNLAMCLVNEKYDRFAAIYALPVLADRVNSVSEYGNALVLNDNLRDLTIAGGITDAFSKSQRTQRLVHDVFRWNFYDLYWAIHYESLTGFKRSGARCAVALERYRLRHGEMPNAIEKSDLEILKAMPVDFWSSKRTRYKRLPSGYVLYSLGQNQLDDAGFTAHEQFDFLEEAEVALEEELRKRNVSNPTLREIRKFDDHAYRIPAWTIEDAKQAIITQPEPSP